MPANASIKNVALRLHVATSPATREKTGRAQAGRVSKPSYEKELLKAIEGGDAAAFEKLYEQYRRKVYFIAWRMLGTESESEDLMQEVFTKIWVNREKLSEINNFNAWLNTLIRNHIYNILRKKAHADSFLRELYSDSKQAEAIPDEIALSELQSLLDGVLYDLPGQQKTVFRLSRLEGYPHNEIAQMLGISTGTVKKHIMEALRKVRSLIKKRVNK